MATSELVTPVRSTPGHESWHTLQQAPCASSSNATGSMSTSREPVWILLRHLLRRRVQRSGRGRTDGSSGGERPSPVSSSRAARAYKAQRQSVDADNAHPEQLTDASAATYDSEERRKAFAKGLDHIGDREAVQARLMAARNKATPPAAALSKTRQGSAHHHKRRVQLLVPRDRPRVNNSAAGAA